MSVGFIVLAHEKPQEVTALARHLNGQGAPVVIHLDKRAGYLDELRKALGDAARVISTQASDWGRFGLVAASLDAARELLREAPGVGHVCLLSGNCMPLRPVAELSAFLSGHPDTDFIESEPAKGWVAGGLDDERFTLYHPLSWRRQRWSFDRLVAVQRRLRVRRRLPDGLVPHLGAQWWCLTANSLRAILDDPRLGTWTRFFRSVWIPDESFFQTVLRRPDAPGQIRSQPLTLARFDARGQPFVFHDDHRDLLGGSDYFFARKIDPDAAALRAWAFTRETGASAFEGRVGEDAFARACAEPGTEHKGIQMAGRFPRGTGVMRPDTARPYGALVCDRAEVLEALHRALGEICPQMVLHGRLFHRAGAQFAGNDAHHTGNLAAHPSVRNYRPEQFLARLVWADRDRPMAFLLDPHDNHRAGRKLAGDPNARIVTIEAAHEAGALRHILTRARKGETQIHIAARFLPIDQADLHAEFAENPAKGGPLVARIAEFLRGRAA
ncbi:MAG: beta-1,6-N-acetylglucosaminyltransferase [Pseudomonadota bacterium]